MMTKLRTRNSQRFKAEPRSSRSGFIALLPPALSVASIRCRGGLGNPGAPGTRAPRRCYTARATFLLGTSPASFMPAAKVGWSCHSSRFLHHQSKSLGDHLRALQFVLPGEGINFFQQATLNADGYDLCAFTDLRPANFALDARPLLPLGGG